jgi:hypothetical protein
MGTASSLAGYNSEGCSCIVRKRSSSGLNGELGKAVNGSLLERVAGLSGTF